MLHLHFSNRFEILADRLLDALQGPRANVFTPDTVVVPHSAAERFIALALADREGICANVDFVYLARWLWQQVACVLPGVGAESPFDAGSLTWRLYALLRDDAFVRAPPPLQAYLGAGGDDPVLAWELSASAAATLEQLITYRPDWLVRW